MMMTEFENLNTLVKTNITKFREAIRDFSQPQLAALATAAWNKRTVFGRELFDELIGCSETGSSFECTEDPKILEDLDALN